MIDAEAIQRRALAAAQAAQEAALLRQNPVPQLVDMPEPEGNAELDSFADLDAVQAGFRKRAKMEASRFKKATDSEYWFAVCFQTREQKEAFLRAMKLIELGDKYLSGELVAKQLGVDLPSADVPYRPDPKIDAAYAALTEEQDNA